jgi:uncharacterized protein YdeI (YjbR/CyaY-like superfamily)
MNISEENKMNPAVDAFINNAKHWNEEYAALRALVLDAGLTEELKWGVPCYTFNDRNIVLIHGFKEYVALLFFKGALMQDPKGILIQQTANVQAGRQIRFASLQEIVKLKTALKAYLKEAIAVEKSGAEIPYKDTEEFPIPEEFQLKLDDIPALRAAFEALTPGRQRAYLLYFAAAKQAKTRESRVKQCMGRILDGKGLKD